MICQTITAVPNSAPTYTGASANVSVVAVSSETSTSSGIEERGDLRDRVLDDRDRELGRPLVASTIPATFSTALPAIATITSPANAWEMWSVWIVG